MTTAILAIHCMVCVGIVITVLLQKGKGADIGAVFGGSSQTVFGSSGAGNFLTRLTSGLAVIFFATSLFLAYTSTRHVSASVFDQSAPAHRVPVKPVPLDRVPATVPPARAPAPPRPPSH
jgi:preprotein translocase subunit SecG